MRLLMQRVILKGCLTVLVMTLAAGTVSCAAAERLYANAALQPFLDGEYASDIAFRPAGVPPPVDGVVRVNGVPFQVALDGEGNWRSVDVGPSRWREMQEDEAAWNEAPWLHGTPEKGYLLLQLPMDQYVRAYVLAASDGRPDKEPVLTLRCGAFQGVGYVSDAMVEVPPFSGKPTASTLAQVEGQVIREGKAEEGRLFVIPVRLPAGDLIKLPIIGAEATFDVELTRRIHTRVAAPDPFMFARMPLGAPSGARVFGITFERSPVKLDVSGASTWNVFPGGRDVQTNLSLENQSAEPHKVELTARWSQKLMEHTGEQSWSLTLQPGEKRLIEHRPACPTFGLYQYELSLRDGAVGDLLVHRTTFARLPQFPKAWLTDDVRSRCCVWWWDGTHGTAGGGAGVDPVDWLGLGYVQHFFGIPDELMKDLSARGVRNYHADGVLMWHEKILSGRHLMHYPRMFLNAPRFEFNEEEEKHMAWCVAETIRQCTETRQKDPGRKIFLGNSSFNFVEELLYRRVPAELFDAVGHEVPSFSRMPERQPELAAFQEAWWYKSVLRKYGYRNGITGCAEGVYRSTNPGNLSWQEQADLYVRDIMHSLSYDFTRITPACFEDVGTGYYYSNWGGSGLFTRYPDVHPKLSYVAYAVAAHLTSDASFVRAVPTGSHSAYCLEFTRRRGDRLFAAWTLRGRRPVTLRGEFDRGVSITDQEGNASPLQVQGGAVQFEVTSSPVFVEGVKACTGLELGEPAYAPLPAVERPPIAPLDSLKGWTLMEQADEVLDDGNFDYPRQKGRFAVREVEDPQEGRCLEFELLEGGQRPGWVPCYQMLRMEEPIEIPGRPTHLGLQVRGNSGWGRIVLELRDAKGERWLSIGQPMAWNSSDIESLSYMIFDGWRWVEVPLPGHYGSGYHWPRYCIWRNGTADGSGDGVVDYPLRLTGLVVEQRQQIVYVNEMVEASRGPVRLSGMRAVYGDPEAVGDWEVRLRSRWQGP